MISGFFLIACAALWRWQGGGFHDFDPPGRRVWYVIPVIAALAAMPDLDWREGLAVFASLLFLSTLPHGRWFDLGRMTALPPRDPSLFERVVERFFTTDPARMAAKTIIGFAPLVGFAVAAGGFVALIAPLIAWGGYWFGWFLWDRHLAKTPTALGEWSSGLAIGLCILSI